MTPEYEDQPRPGLGGTVRRVADSAFALLQTRLEILGLELAQERGNLARLFIVALAIVFCFQAALVLGLVFIVLAVGEPNRVAALGFAALALLLMSVGGAWWLWSWLKRRPPMFGTTIAEFRKDREWLRGRR